MFLQDKTKQQHAHAFVFLCSPSSADFFLLLLDSSSRGQQADRVE